nr:MAG TPA: hypothetical protein [Caudoviricetes sp.]
MIYWYRDEAGMTSASIASSSFLSSLTKASMIETQSQEKTPGQT